MTTKRKAGRPAKPQPSRPSRPRAMPGGVTVTTKLDIETLEKLDKLAADQSVSRAGLIRKMICEHIQDAEDIKYAERALASIDSGETKTVLFSAKRGFNAKEKK